MNYRYLVKIGFKIKESTVLKLKKKLNWYILYRKIYLSTMWKKKIVEFITTGQLFGLILE